MKVVIAPDSFKGSMTALEAATAIAAGVRDICAEAEIALVPLADGGEGTVDALVAAMPRSCVMTYEVDGPLGEAVVAHYGLLGPIGATAVVEMAAASGLTLILPEMRDPMRASTYGTGELIRASLSNAHIERLIVGVGGSATNDGGLGALAALGVRFFDAGGAELSGPYNPGIIPTIASADASGALSVSADIVIACDVVNPLVGPYGASAVFGPQKGATAELVAILDEYLAHLAPILDSIADQRSGAASAHGLATRPGGGAAGGLAAGLLALFPQAVMQPGIDLVLDTADFDTLIADADLVITGEGRLDAQTLSGKTIAGVLRRTAQCNARTIALAGSVDSDAAAQLQGQGLEAAYAIIDLAGNVHDAMARGPELLRRLARRVVGA